jgi:hypothetical protein
MLVTESDAPGSARTDTTPADRTRTKNVIGARTANDLSVNRQLRLYAFETVDSRSDVSFIAALVRRPPGCIGPLLDGAAEFGHLEGVKLASIQQRPSKRCANPAGAERVAEPVTSKGRDIEDIRAAIAEMKLRRITLNPKGKPILSVMDLVNSGRR